jgi:hypothetical protein
MGGSVDWELNYWLWKWLMNEDLVIDDDIAEVFIETVG